MAIEVNEHIPPFLKEYLARSEPGYAVLIAGPWGVGKTFLVKEFLRGIQTARPLYVSLNGVSTEDDLRRRLVYAAYPLLADSAFRALGSLARSALGVFRFRSDLKIEDYADLDKFDVLVLDDIERAHLSLEVVLGVVNQFVEHDKQKVIILTSLVELEKKDLEYARKIEKVVGFTLTVKPETRLAIRELYKQSSDALKKFIDESEGLIVSVFEATESDNLRVLLQALLESEPLAQELATHSGLSESYRDTVLTLFVVLNMLYKLGIIKREHISERRDDWFTLAFNESQDRGEKDPLALYQDHFQQVDLHSGILSNDYLESKICDGLHRPKLLEESINDELAKTSPDSSPEWRNVWHYMDRDEKVTLIELDKIQVRISNYEYTDPAVILHVFGIMLEMRKIGIIECKLIEIYRKAVEYVDHLIDTQALQLDKLPDDMRHGSAYGLAFNEGRTHIFRRLTRHANARIKEGKYDRHVKQIREAFDSFADNPDILSSLIGWDGNQDIYSEPLLNTIDARQFSRQFLDLSADKQVQVTRALAGRYKENPYPDVLEGERRWLRSVRKEILRKLEPSDRLRHARITRLLEWSIDRYV